MANSSSIVQSSKDMHFNQSINVLLLNAAAAAPDLYHHHARSTA
jgi:hypothetical protein